MQEKMTGQEIEENTLINRWVNEYMKEKEKREQLEKEYKLLNEKYEQALNDYDELLQSHPYCSNWHNSCESINNSNCYFKQLARKTQECEGLKRKLSNQEQLYQNEIEIYNKSCLQLRQENDDLYLERLALNTANSGINALLEVKEQECDRYREALEEIETATKINCEEICGRKFTDCKDTSCFSVNILDIISKAKGEGICQ